MLRGEVWHLDGLCLELLLGHHIAVLLLLLDTCVVLKLACCALSGEGCDDATCVIIVGSLVAALVPIAEELVLSLIARLL